MLSEKWGPGWAWGSVNVNYSFSINIALWKTSIGWYLPCPWKFLNRRISILSVLPLENIWPMVLSDAPLNAFSGPQKMAHVIYFQNVDIVELDSHMSRHIEGRKRRFKETKIRGIIKEKKRIIIEKNWYYKWAMSCTMGGRKWPMRFWGLGLSGPIHHGWPVPWAMEHGEISFRTKFVGFLFLLNPSSFPTFKFELLLQCDVIPSLRSFY